jgi:hypothetical protein
MRPNSKTYNPEYSSSFQKSSFYSKPKFQDTDRWDHGGFDQLQTENTPKYSKLKKSKINVEEKTMAADSLNAGASQTGFTLENDKWTHDKFQETVNQEVKPKEQVQEKPKRERKPDRALYNVRQRCGIKDEEKKLKETIKTPQSNESLPSPQPAKDVLLGFGEKEAYQFEDDRLSISNVSTAMSDPFKSWEEESYGRVELLKEKQDSLDIIQSPKSSKKGEESLSEVLFEIMVQSEQAIVTIKVHKGEEDYLAFLNKLCCDQHLDARSALYFKINMLDMINEAGADNANVTAALDHLLDINYKLLMYECGQSSEISHLIAPYINEGFQDEYPVISSFDDSGDES